MGSNALNALLGKAFSERSEDFSAAQRRESNGIFSGRPQRGRPLSLSKNLRSDESARVLAGELEGAAAHLEWDRMP